MQNTKFLQVRWIDNHMLVDKLFMDTQTSAKKILYMKMILAQH